LPKVLFPDYMLTFRCIGNECEDSCCKKLEIPVNRDTYLKYKRLEDRKFSERLVQGMEVLEASKRRSDQYAVIKLDEATGHCTFLENGLCSIQMKLGESCLSKVCASYPRRSNQVDDTFETSALLSCPEAARLALLNPEGMSFTYVEAEQPITIGARMTTKVPSGIPYAKYFWDIRTFAVEMLQNRSYSLSHRVMQLAVLAVALDESCAKGKGDQIPHIIQRFRDQLDGGGEIAKTETFPTDLHFQFKFLNALLLLLISAKVSNNDKYMECLDQYIDGIQKAGDGFSEQELVRYYGECRRNYYDPFMAEHEYIFENYLVNQLFSSAFPYDTELKLFTKVFYMGVIYGLLRMQLIGMAACHERLTADMIIQLIYSFIRNFEHNQNFKKVLLEQCEAGNIRTLGHLSLLVMESDAMEDS